MSHTPEPWTIDATLATTIHGDVFDPVFDSLGLLVAYVPRPCGSVCGAGETSAEDEAANQCLIAAAPELLEAITLALPYVEMAEHDDAYKAGAVKKIVRQIRAAIAKATDQHLSARLAEEVDAEEAEIDDAVEVVE